ncbi:MAG: replication-associated recombination protein A [Sphingobacteriaceae bacterium]|nr:replication-associated recombination protein A [Cytophagaceae bacterium]
MSPLAERMRPATLDAYIGQSHLVGPGAVLRQAVEAGRIPSFILWGPPGTGKTTLATLVARTLNVPFYTLSAISAGVKDIRETIDSAKKQRFFNAPSPILFIDEIHRFSKSQQDSLLGAVEQGVVTLIGATTENPSFEVIPALLSRCQVYVLKALEKDELIEMLNRALAEDEFLKDQPVTVKEYEALLQLSGGDGRKLYNALELVVNSRRPGEALEITNELVLQKIQQNIALYDKGGEAHYDIISAFIKAIRGSDPNAAVYWLARMLEGGEDIEFIARRILISASEDIGLANPNALLMANTCFQAIRAVGLPEARIILSQTVIYLATSPKSNSAYAAINAAQALVQKTGSPPVPLSLRNAPTKLMKDLDYGKNYGYAHDHPGNFIEQEFLPENLSGTKLFDPQANGAEEKLRERLRAQWGERYGY